MHENARFFSLPDTNSVRQFLQKHPFFDFSHFWMTALKNTNLIGFLAFSISFFFFFLFLFLQHKKEKTNNVIFFSKTSFLTSPNFATTLFLHNVTLYLCFQKCQKHYKNGGGETVKNLDQFLTLDLDQFLTQETPNLEPVFNSTANK